MEMPNQKSGRQGRTSASELAKRVMGPAGRAEMRLPVVTAYLEKDPAAAAALSARLERVASRADTLPSAARELELLRAEVMSRAQTRYALEAAPAAQARVRDALADYLAGRVFSRHAARR
jgi:hypothetical protein